MKQLLYNLQFSKLSNCRNHISGIRNENWHSPPNGIRKINSKFMQNNAKCVSCLDPHSNARRRYIEVSCHPLVTAIRFCTQMGLETTPYLDAREHHLSASARTCKWISKLSEWGSQSQPYFSDTNTTLVECRRPDPASTSGQTQLLVVCYKNNNFQPFIPPRSTKM